MSRRSTSAGESSSSNARWWDHLTRNDSLPSLPFSKGEQQHQRKASSSSERDAGTLRRQSDTIDADDDIKVDDADARLRTPHQEQQLMLHQQPSAEKIITKERRVSSAYSHAFVSDQPQPQLQQHKSSPVPPTETPSKSSHHRRRSTATTNEPPEDILLEVQHQMKLHRRASEVFLQEQKKYGYNGYRDDYFLGDAIKSSSHMIIESTPERVIRAVESLQMHDFAWVKRSDGTYTYAILTHRPSSPTTTDSNEVTSKHSDEVKCFVVNDAGSTKMIPKSRWHERIRLVHNYTRPRNEV